MSKPDIFGFHDPATFTITYVVADPATKRAAIIDSVLDFDYDSGRTDTASADAVIDYVTTEGLNVEWILETHIHADHLTAAPYIKQQIGGRIAAGKEMGKFMRDSAPTGALRNVGKPFGFIKLSIEIQH